MSQEQHYVQKEDLLREIIKVQSDPKADKTQFAIYCMMIINNLKKRPNFAGYTTNWTEDYVSNAIYKMLKYIHNFDHTRISRITKEPVSPFAYLTQIAKAAFLEVINKRKNEEAHIKGTIQYQELESLIGSQFKREQNRQEVDNYKDGVIHYNLKKLEIDGVKFQTIHNMLVYLMEKGVKKVKIEYPKRYSISLEEYEKINKDTKFDYLDLTKKSYKQKVQEVEDPQELEIEEILQNDIDDWGDGWDEKLEEELEIEEMLKSEGI